MSAASDSTKRVIRAATETLTGMISNLAPVLRMRTVVSDKKISMIVPINKAVLAVKSSDSRLPARIPGTKWQISARISESPQFSIRDTRAMVDPAALIAARISGAWPAT